MNEELQGFDFENIVNLPDLGNQTRDERFDFTKQPAEFAGLSLLDSFSQGVREDTFVGLMIDNYDKSDVQFEPDETSYEDKEKYLEDNAPKLRKEYYRALIESSNSIDEMDSLLPQALEKSRVRDYTESLGFGTQLGIGFASQIPDVLAITGMSLVSPFTATALASTRARAFASGAVIDGAFQVAQDNYGQRDRSMLEMTLSPIFSGALNSVLTHGISAKTSLHKEIMDYQTKDAMGITKEVEERIAKAQTKEEKDSIYKEAIDGALKEHKVREEDFASGSEERIAKQFKNFEDKIKADYENGRLSKGAYNKLRHDNEKLGKTSPSKTIRDIANKMFIDGTLQHNNLNVQSLTELQDSYEAISIRKTRDLFMPIERKLSKYKGENKLSSRFSIKFLDGSNVGVSNVAGTMQAIRNLKIGSDDYAFEVGVKRLMDDEGLTREQAEDIAKDILDASKKQSLENGKLNTRFKDEKFLKGEVKETDDYFTNVFKFSGNKELIDKGFTYKDINDFWFNGLKSHWKKRNTSKDGKLDVKNVWTKDKEEAIKKVAKRLTDFLGTPRVFSSENVSNRDIFLKAFEENGVSEEVMNEFFDTLKTKTGSKYMKSRMPFNRGYIYNKKGVGEISMLDFISTDMYAVQAKYMKENSGKIAGQNYKFLVGEKELFEDGKEGVAQELSLGTKEGADYIKAKTKKELNDMYQNGKISKAKADSEMARLEHWIDHLHGNPTAVDPNSPMHKVMQIGANLNSWRLLGKVPLAMMAELNNVLWYSGVRNYLENTKSLKTAFEVLRKGKTDDEVWKEAGDVLGLGNEFVQGIRNMVNDHDFDSDLYNARRGWLDKALTKGLEISEKMGEFTLMVGGMKPFTANLQYSLYTGLSKMIREISEDGVTGFHKQVFKEMGIDESMAKRIQNQMKKYGKNKQVFNFNKWDDEEASLNFSIGMKRLIDNVVQRPTLGGKLGVTVGDKVIASTVTGKAFLELKQYMFQSYVKQTGKMLESKSIYHYMMMLSQIGLLSSLYIPEQLALSGGDKERLEKAFDPLTATNKIMNRVTVFGFPSAVLGAGSRATLGDNYLNIHRDTNAGVAQAVFQQLPIVDLLNQMGSVVPNMVKATYEDDYNVDKLVKNFDKLTPNVIPKEILFNHIEDELKPNKLEF